LNITVPETAAASEDPFATTNGRLPGWLLPGRRRVNRQPRELLDESIASC
jgi:hypothetical protein